MSTSKMIVGLDGSPASKRALAWCAAHAVQLDSEVVVVHAIDLPIVPGVSFAYMPIPSLTAAQHEELSDIVGLDWCKPLADAGVPYRVVLAEGPAAEVIVETARAEDAELIVTGRRGRGGFAEMILGSTSHTLTHLADRPIVVVP